MDYWNSWLICIFSSLLVHCMTCKLVIHQTYFKDTSSFDKISMAMKIHNVLCFNLISSLFMGYVLSKGTLVVVQFNISSFSNTSFTFKGKTIAIMDMYIYMLQSHFMISSPCKFHQLDMTKYNFSRHDFHSSHLKIL